MDGNIRDRIVEIRKVPGRDLLPCPLNWRKHPQAQREALRGVLSEVGVADVLKAWQRPDGKLELIDGHLRAEELADHEWNVAILDVTEAEARYLLATHDTLGAMAEPDAAILDGLLREMNSGDSAVQQMLADLAAGAGLYQDNKEESPIDTSSKMSDELEYRIIVKCESETQQITIIEQLESEGIECQPLIS
jgi:hypothetical protein